MSVALFEQLALRLSRHVGNAQTEKKLTSLIISIPPDKIWHYPELPAPAEDNLQSEDEEKDDITVAEI